MFKEFNVKFEDAEIIGGADNLLEGTGVTKVILRGDNKLSSLDSTFKDCSQLDTVDGELDLNGISDIDSLLENSNLVTSIDLKNVNNKDITANNAFSHVNQINIGGETYNKEAIQNIISSREWTFNNINYIDTVGEDVVTHTPNISEEDENTQIVIKDALEQKVRDIEIKGQTYQNLIEGKEGAELLADIKLESIDGSPSELKPPIDHPVCVEVIEGQTYQNLIEGKGEYNLTDTYNATWTESNSSFEDMPNMIEIPEIFGNTVQDENDLNIIQSVGDLYVDEEGNPILDEEGNEQYKLEVVSSNSNLINYEDFLDNEGYMKAYTGYKLKKPFYVNAGDKFTLIARGRTLKQDYSSVIFGDRPSMSIVNNTFFMTNGITYTFVKESEEMVDKLFILTANKSGWITYIFIGNSGYKCNLVIEKFGLFKGEVTLENYESYNENKTTILMPQQLNKIGDIKDKLYWDEDKGHYCIEQKFAKEEMKNSNWNIFNQNTEFIYFIGSTMKNVFKHSDKGLCNKLPCYQQYELAFMTKEGIALRDNRIYIVLSKTRGILTLEQLKTFVNDLFVIWELEIYNTIDLLHLNKKYSLDTYMPTTYLECSNSPIQPSRMYFETDKLKYKPLALETNKDYTIQFNCEKVSEEKVKFNLGGSEEEIQAVVGTNHINITTPAELSSNRLYISGQGNKVSEVMLIEGDMKQYHNYFDGIESVGVLQKDGKYKIDIISNSRTLLFEKDDCIPFVSGTMWYNDFLKNKTKVVPNTIYHAVSYNAISDSFAGLLVKCYSKDGTFIKEINTSAGIEPGDQGRFTVPQDCHYVNFRMYTYEIKDDLFSSNKIILHQGNLNNVINSKDVILEKSKPISKLEILLSQPLAKDDKLYWNKSNNRYEIDRNGVIEIPTVEGDVVNLPRLYQREDTVLTVEYGNIKPSEIKIEYKNLN